MLTVRLPRDDPRVGLAQRTRAKLREDLGFPERPPERPRKREFKTAAEVFGERTLRDLEHARGEIQAWLAQLPPSQRVRRLRALRQVLNAAVGWDLMLRNPASAVKARAVKAPEVEHFADTAEIDLVAEELGAPWSVLIVLATETGLRPEEWCALERRDLDLRAKVLTVQRAYTVAGGLKPLTKTDASRRSVPLTDRALDALDRLPVRIDTPLLFFTHYYGGMRGEAGYLNLGNWRKRTWLPALRGASLERSGELWLPGPYAMRHVCYVGARCRDRHFRSGTADGNQRARDRSHVWPPSTRPSGPGARAAQPATLDQRSELGWRGEERRLALRRTLMSERCGERGVAPPPPDPL